jgi:dTDP-4-amino-4,6-dideoxygalactose transaminase
VALRAPDPRAVGWHAAADRSVAAIAELLDQPPVLLLTGSCTQALEASAAALQVGPGDEVIVPAYSFPSTANPFVQRGATLRFADADLRTGNVSAAEIHRCITERTRAVVVMHYGGVACEMDEVVELCRERGLPLIEDAAHSLFAGYRGTPLGRFGTFGAFSFHRTKNVSAFDGGALVVNDRALLDDVSSALDKGTNRAAFDRGEVDAYEWVAQGSAGRLSAPLAPLLEADLAAAPDRQRRRHEIWSTYADALRGWADELGASLPAVPDGCEHSAHLFWVMLPPPLERRSLVDHCASRGVEVARHFGSLPDSRFGRSIRDPRDRCPNAGELAERLVRLPLHHDLSDDDVTRVLDAVTTWPAGST